MLFCFVVVNILEVVTHFILSLDTLFSNLLLSLCDFIRTAESNQRETQEHLTPSFGEDQHTDNFLTTSK